MKYQKIFVAVLSVIAAAGLLIAGVVGGSDVSYSEDYPMSDATRPTEEQLKAELTELQYEVTRCSGTEPPFANEYWNHKGPGIYVDVVSGEPLFSSLDKFDSGSGWPSFTKPLLQGTVVDIEDRSHGIVRTEVRSKGADSHLGHVFADGPGPGGLRYCINSASLRFVAAENLEREGFGQFVPAFVEAGVIEVTDDDSVEVDKEPEASGTEEAILAAGCFWGVEHLFLDLDGVLSTEVGYIGGHTKNPTYRDVTTGRSGHAESVRLVFNPSKVSYSEILNYFFRLHDPTTRNRQHNDIGSQYRSAIFYLSEAQREAAEKVRAEVDRSDVFINPIVTEIVEAGPFWSAEEYHQEYLEKNPGGYMCHVLRD